MGNYSTICVGKYTNSYRHHLESIGVDVPNGYAWRLAEGQIDDSCFDGNGHTFYTMADALASLKQALDCVRQGDADALDYACVLTDALLEAETRED